MKIRGPYKHKSGWRITIISDDDEEKSQYYQTRKEAVAAKELEKAAADGGLTKPVRHRRPDGTREWGIEVLDKIAKRVMLEPNDDQLIKVGRTLAHLFATRDKLAGVADLEARLGKVEKRQGKIDSKAKHGAGAKRSTRPSRETPKPGEPVC